MTPKVLAALSGVSVRTLHHYDRIGLLCPQRDPINGYRDYSEQDIERLQQILLFKACGFMLSEIGALLDHPEFELQTALTLQRKALAHEQQRLAAMIASLDQTLKAMEGATTLTDQERFKGFDFTENPYEAEARARWGDAAVEASNARLADATDDEKKDLAQGMDALFERLAEVRFEPPASSVAQAAIADMYAYMNTHFGYHYTPAAFAGLGQLYVADARFTANIDRYGDGLAAFLAEAMGLFAEQSS